MSSERLAPNDTHEEFVSELFHENTKQHRSDARFVERILTATYDPGFQQMMGPAHKIYPGSSRVDLPRRLPKARRDFDTAVLTRRSSREFSGGRLSFAEAAKLIHFSYGVTGTLPTESGFSQPLRAAPSGGALYPVEMYVLVQKVEGLKSGIYHYDPVAGCLEIVDDGNPFAELIRMTFVSELKTAAMAVALSGISIKNRVKYGERGYRFMLIEAGHIAQNFLLTANALKLNAFSLGGFVDDELDTLLKIDGFDETSLYLMAVGKRA